MKLVLKTSFSDNASKIDLFHLINSKVIDDDMLTNSLILQAMQRAEYSTNNIGHFGLQLSSYCHFTSPIRRYPYLIAHRLIKSILNKEKVSNFSEKDKLQEGWINGGFFVLNKEVFDYIDNRENCIFEKEPLQNISKDGQLMAFKHEGFWHPMDTLRDNNYLNEICK